MRRNYITDSSNVDKFYKLSLFIIVILLFLAPALHTLKLIRISVLIPSLTFYIGFPLVILLLAFSFAILILRNGFFVDFFELLLIFIGFWTTCWTIWFKGDWIDIGGNVSRLIFVFLLYFTTRHYKLIWTKELIFKLAWSGAVGVMIGLSYLYILGVFGPYPVYMGLNSESTLLLLALALTRCMKRYRLTIVFVMLLIILSGKRGVLLAAIVMMLCSWIFPIKYSAISSRILQMIFIFCSIVLACLIVGLNGSLSFLPEQLTKKFQVSSEQSTEAKIRKITAGRNLEVTAVVHEWQQDPIKFWIGSGFGAHFTLQNENEEITKSTVHISPLGLVHIYGFPLAVILIFSIVWKISWVIVKRSFKDELIYYQALGLTSLGLFTVSMSSFIIMQNYLLWIALGLMSNPSLTLNKLTEIANDKQKN
ncbi:hypothetical protein [Legionella brunensis]|uniref:O-Antigen ligase n=1 Tax=Legionella brunensis TaxID=29422 RepID=A0A0W0SDF6_9GAMM|nr:hypothetical protein [Legionella brunensis]KTC81431.1 hypothetical protein Lbru_1951 [Legionella brunensis]